MKKAIKALYILTIAIIVFLGGLLISQGMRMQREAAAPFISEAVIESEEGSAL